MKATINQLYKHIYTIRGKYIMLDEDLAELYGVETKYLNRSVSRNVERFPENFRFQLTKEEFEDLRFQIGTSSRQSLRFQIGTLKNKVETLRSQNATIENQRGLHRKYLPYVFTEQGVSMLSAVLRSETAVKVSIQIMDAFVEMRKIITQHAGLIQRMDQFEHKLLNTDDKVEQIFKALEDKSLNKQQGIFYNGQTFDAYVFVADLIKSAKKSIFLIDNYLDESVLHLLTKRANNIEVKIYTKQITKTLALDLDKHNSQYYPIEIIIFKNSHDRFLIIDEKNLYHIGSSLKDLGKKWFAFSKLEMNPKEILDKLEEGVTDKIKNP